ncbi:MAG: DoxX family protein [Bacteroidales bacterium]|nr:DoxX family protein [Candidatus Sodaliphilus aphodohippi]
MEFLKKLFLYCTGYTYSNLSRLFLRLFTGVLFLQLCTRQIMHFTELAPTFEGVLGFSPEGSLTLLLVIELLSAACIILGLLTRLAVIAPLLIMVMAERVVATSQGIVGNQLFNFEPGYPLMFIGIFIYMLLAGPGKISLDYIISAHIIDSKDDNEVLDNA